MALAMDVRDRLHVNQNRAFLPEILDGLRGAQRPRGIVIALLPPGAHEFVTADGAPAPLDSLRGELLAGRTSARLTRETAALLGLPARTALAGLARVEDDENGTWGVVAVASAQRERDREQWAKWRLLLSVVTATGLVSAFAGLALRKQRSGLTLQNQVLTGAYAPAGRRAPPGGEQGGHAWNPCHGRGSRNRDSSRRDFLCAWNNSPRKARRGKSEAVRRLGLSLSSASASLRSFGVCWGSLVVAHQRRERSIREPLSRPPSSWWHTGLHSPA